VYDRTAMLTGISPFCLLLLTLLQNGLPDRPFHDLTHVSRVFGQPRSYRVILPPDYATSGKSYPVIYFFHGHSDRYTLEHYDGGTDFIPKMVDYAGARDVIVVLVDGYVARDYTGFYGGFPWDVRLEGGDWDFGPYFLELIEHIDGRFRTRTDRRHRATSGLSMGGFMSLWLSARYPHLVGSASSFNPGPEFYTGDPERRVLWRPKDHVPNHGSSMIRLIRASGDFISQYHEETREAYANADEVGFEYRVDEFHKHWITSVAETFDFHLKAFQSPALNNVPVSWSHSNPYRKFSVWGYDVAVEGNGKGFTYLTDVRQGGFRVTTRQWAPDGPPVASSQISVRTAPVYEPGARYRQIDHCLGTGKTDFKDIEAGPDGRITVQLEGTGRQVSFAGPGTGALPPVLLPVTASDRLRLPPGVDLELPLRVYNPRGEPLTEVTVELKSEYPTVQLLHGSARVESIAPGSFVDLSKQMRIRLTAGAGYFAPTRLELTMIYDDWYSVTQKIDILVVPEVIPRPVEIRILDGRAAKFKMFRQAGNRGGGGLVDVEVTEGKGNGNGVLEPGEEATIWVRLEQGMDPFDKNTWHRCRVYSDSPWLREVAIIESQKQREWTSAMDRASVVRLSEGVGAGTTIPVLLDSESWSFHYTPDVRYGAERLSQAIQLHSNHLHKFEIEVK
jgi:pimeloyl-ACP methyl ester carboxylesterase